MSTAAETHPLQRLNTLPSWTDKFLFLVYTPIQEANTHILSGCAPSLSVRAIARARRNATTSAKVELFFCTPASSQPTGESHA